MAATLKGAGVVWSCGTLTFTGGITAVANTDHYTQSISYERTSDVARIKGTEGDVAVMVFSGHTRAMKINVVPSGSSVTNAVASGREFMPKPGDQIKLTDSNGGLAGTETNWICVTSTQNRTVDGALTIDLSLENAEASDLSVTVS